MPVPAQVFCLSCFRWKMPMAESLEQERYLEPQRGILDYIRESFVDWNSAEFLLRAGVFLLGRDSTFSPNHWRVDTRAGDYFHRRGHVAIIKMGPLYLWCRIVESGIGADWWPRRWLDGEDLPP